MTEATASPMTAALSAAVAAQPIASFASGDPADALPPAARQKLERARADRDAARAAYMASSDTWRETWAAHGRAESFARARLELPRGRAHEHPATAIVADISAQQDLPEHEARVLAPVAAAKAKLAAATAARDRAAERLASFSFVAHVEEWLTRHARPGVQFEAARPVDVGKVRDIAAAVAQARDELAAIDEQFAIAERAPLPADELRRRALAEIDAVAGSGALTINPRDRSARPLGLARRLSIGAVTGASGSVSIVGDAGSAFLLGLVRDRLVEAVETVIAAADFAGALSDAERDARFVELAARRLEVERVEAEGRMIARRPDIDPRAFLEVEVA